MCPFFRPTKTAKHFSPLSCSCSAAHEPRCRRHAGDLSATIFPPKKHLSVFTNFTSFCFFRSSSSICFPLPVPFSKQAKKAQTTTFLIKFLRCFFSFYHLFFLLAFLGLKAVFLFDLFIFSILQGWGKANSGSGRRNRGGRFVSFFFVFFGQAPQEAALRCIARNLFPWVMWHHTADPIGGFLWVSFVAQSYGSDWLLSCRREPFWILTSNTIAFYFSAKGCQKVVSCADTRFLFFGKICMC